MRRKAAGFFLAVTAVTGSLFLLGHSAYAQIDLAQPPGTNEDDEGVVTEEDETQQSDAESDGEGQSSTEAETGADEGETAEGTAEEGPPWTYQMARLGIILLVLVGALIGLMYRKMIVLRQRGPA